MLDQVVATESQQAAAGDAICRGEEPLTNPESLIR
jgi:hypothetical protein